MDVYPRSYWVTALIIGAVVNFGWPYLTHSDNAFGDGLFRAAAWCAGIAAVYLFVAWGTRSGRAK
jgi:hypothetical protein